MDNRPKTIGMIGGTGRMGRMFERLFIRAGHRVLLAGRSTPLSHEALAEQSDVVIVTVPIHQTVEVIERLAPRMRPGQLFTDFTSIKGPAVEAMLASPASVIGCHPIFGPMEEVAGQNVVLCPARPGPWLDWYKQLLEAMALNVRVMSAAEHDKAMGVVQGLTHFINISFAKTLQTEGVQIEQILQVCSPVYRVAFAILSRILSGDPALYGQIQVENRETLPVIQAFVNNGRQIAGLVEAADLEGFYALFNQASDYLGPYKQTARLESDLLIERMAQHIQEKERG